VDAMSVIYEPKGRAAEYSPLAANLYKGCGHGCTYCYAPLILRTNRESFRMAQPRTILRELERDAKKLKNDERPILLCFTCDPYQPIDTEYKYTRRAIEVLHRYNLKVTILTKGAKRSERDFDLLAAHPELSTYATTLVFADERERQQYEPYAPSTQERIATLKKAHEFGISTWVSLEPVFHPEDAYKLIKQTHKFVDMFKVGKLNYSEEAKKVDWHEFCIEVIELLQSLGKDYYIKKDLLKFL